MAMFDFLLSPQKKIAKHTRRLTNRDAQEEDRDASAQFLANEGSPPAIMGLLSRFDMALEQSLKDQSEKDVVYSLLLGLGDAAVEPVEAWLRQCRSIARPLALLGELRGEEAAILAAYGILEHEREHGNDFKPDKKKAVLIWLAERRDERAIEMAEPFLDDFDEGVRYAATEVVAAQRDEAGREPLLAVLTNAEEESNRLRSRVSEIFAQFGWSVAEAAEILATTLPDGFALRGDRIVKA